MHRTRSRIGKRAPCNRQELPVITGGVQCQLEDAERRVVADLAGREGRAEAMMSLAARTDRELADPVERICHWRAGQRRTRLHRCQSLVNVVVPVQEDIYAGSV